MATGFEAFDSSGSYDVSSLVRGGTLDAPPRNRTARREIPSWPERPPVEPEQKQPGETQPHAQDHETHQAVDHEEHENVWANGLDWPAVLWISGAHVLALGAFFFFTWKALAIFAFLTYLTGAIGVCMGYHRLLTHGSFTTYRPIRWLFAWFGGLSGEGSAITWIANHRKHHAHSDKDGDPHSPREGGLWAHFLWLMPNHGAKYHKDMAERYAPDLVKDPVIRFLDKTFLLWHWLLGVGLLLTGWYFWDWYTGLSFLFWGTFLRMVFVLHITWFVNSATHMWGYRNYETTDDSTNLWWVGLLAYGEGWHNNHHAYQRLARHGHRWWEIDVTYWGILALEKMGLAWNVVRKVPPNQNPA